MSGIKNLHILLGSLETAQASYWYYSTVNLCHLRQIATTLLKQLTILLDILESTETLSCLLLSDAAKYMVASGAIIKYPYPKLFHVTCVAYLLHNCVIEVKSHFEDVDQQQLKSKRDKSNLLLLVARISLLLQDGEAG